MAAAQTNTEKITNLTVQMAESLAMQKQTRDDVAKISRILEGNGHPGLIKRIDCLENDWNHHKTEYETEKNDLKERKRNRFDISWKVILLILGAIVPNIVIFVSNLFK